jgi:hypothetical protein
MGGHVAWPELLSVAVWQQTAQSVLGTGQHLQAFQNDPAAKAVWGHYVAALPAQLQVFGRLQRTDVEANQEGAAIDAYFQRVSTALQPAAAAVGGSAEAGTLLAALGSGLASVPCASCVAGRQGAHSQHLCRWTLTAQAADKTTLANRGKCLEPFFELFDWAESISRGAYQAVLAQAPTQLLEFSTGVLGGPNAQLGTGTDGLTQEVDPRKTRNVLVLLDARTPNQRLLTLDDFLSMLYILVHECLVHGFCAVNVEEKAATLSRSFHDGWMDCVAAAMVGEAALRGGPGIRRYGQLFKQQMDRTRTVRYDTQKPTAAADAVKWTRGADAFEAMEFLFESAFVNLGRPVVEARERMLAFSLMVNACPSVSHDERGKLVATLNQYFWRNNPHDRGLAVLRNTQAIDFVKDFLLYGDAEALTRRMVSTRWTV